LVVQVGKWRRQVKVSKINACVGNNAGVIKLPKNKKEGDIPKIAVATGGADSMECVFKKMGIDDAEVTGGSGKGQIQVYYGHGGAQAPGGSAGATDFWNDLKKLKTYDMVVLSCEGSEYGSDKFTVGSKAAMHEYANAGGKVFASHYHYYWFKYGPADFASTASWTTTGTFDGEYDIDSSFPKGKAFADWLVNTKASTTKGKITLKEIRDDMSTVNAKTTLQWIYKPGAAKYMSFGTPVGKKPESQCGRGVFTDLHAGSGNIPGGTYPNGCTSADMSPQEKALAFLLFDLASCIQGDETEPVPPPPE
jgi:hypothetical protein